ncbi:MAG: hypothetical protein HY452_02170 [Parcubacteria group bacterium]|nr:hypothetical protein [Parcubacteria group bacterium]
MNKTNTVLISSFIVFFIFVGYMVFKEAGRDGYDYNLDREDVIEFFTQKINEVSPEPPVLGGKWLVTRFRFAGGNTVYVEYEDGHIARAFLLILTKTVATAPDYRIIGFFEPGPLGYKLLAGEDSAIGRPQEIYEHNETAGKWIKVN